jgi:hypothetical protein
MAIFLLIISLLLFAASIASTLRKPTLSPVLAFVGLTAIWLSDLLPLNGHIIITWLCIVAIVTAIQAMDGRSKSLPAANRQRAYILAGAVCGMILSLACVSIAATIGTLYGIMVVATAAGAFLGSLLYSNTPEGKKAAPIASATFLERILTLSFPIAITIMQIGICAIIAVELYEFSNPA